MSTDLAGRPWVMHARLPHEVATCDARNCLHRGVDFDESGNVKNLGPGAKDRRIEKAKTVCASCPVLEPCRQWALTDPDPCEGLVAGGLSTKERRRIRKGYMP